MEAIRYIVDTLLWLLTLAFVLRLLFQLVRADFRDPMADAVVRVTNWLILPLRRILPPVGKIDSATVLAVILVAVLRTFAILALSGGGVADPAAVPQDHADRLGRDGAAYLSVRFVAVCVDELCIAGRLCARRAAARTTLRTGLEAGTTSYTADRTNRFFRVVGVHRDRCAADTAALSMVFYMPEISALASHHAHSQGGVPNAHGAGARTHPVSGVKA